MNVFLVFGTRPQIIKSIPVLKAAERRGLEIKVIHTGQHYDDLLSDIFFRIFSVSPPMLNLGVGSGSQGYQTAEIITRLEKVLLNKKPDLVLVPGDTNSALASALAAVKLHIRVAHIEAGARSYNMEM